MKEIWKEIEGFNEYKVSSLGNVMSFKLFKTGKLMTLYKSKKKPYLTVGFRKVPGGKKFKFTVSRLVAQAFIPNPENKPCACHKDDNPANNRADNLFWGTWKENTQDMISKGRRNGGKPKKSVLCLDTGEVFPSIIEASRSVDRNKASLSCCLRKLTSTCAGLRWEYHSTN